MSAVTVEHSTPTARHRRLDAEFYTSPLRASTAAMLSNGQDWLSLREVGGDATSGGTPRGHDLQSGDVEFITIDGISPLWLDSSRSKLVTSDHRDKELRRVRLAEGDVVVTIKRRICQAAVVGPAQVGAVVNQDVALLRPTGVLEPEVIAACLVSTVGQSQARLIQTEQINPYLSVTSLNELKFPRLDPGVQRDVVVAVRARSALLGEAEDEVRKAASLVAGATGLRETAAFTRVTSTLSTVEALDRMDAEFFANASLTFERATEVLTLGDRRITSALSNGATPAAAEYDGEGYPIFKVGGLSRFGIADWLGDRVDRDSGAARAWRAKVHDGDVFVLAAAHDTRYIGKSAVVHGLPKGENECRVVGEIVVAHPGSEMSGPTLSAYLNVPAVRREMQRLVRGQSAHLYPRDVAHLPVPLVSEDIQRRVRTHYDACARARRGSEEQLLLARKLVEDAVRH